MNADQLMGLVRALLAASGPLAALLVQVGLPEDKAKAWLEIGSGFLTIFTPLLAAWWATRVHSDAAKVAAVAAMPGVEVTVNPTAAPAAAVAAANDPGQPKVSTTIMALIALGALLFGGGLGITACTTADKGDPAAGQNAIQVIDLAYTAAKIGAPLVCAQVPDPASCLTEVNRASTVLDVAWRDAKALIASAPTDSNIQKAQKAFMAALDVWASVRAKYGVSRGGG